MLLISSDKRLSEIFDVRDSRYPEATSVLYHPMPLCFINRCVPCLPQTCSDGWTSMYGVVVFYYRRNMTTTTTQHKSRLPLTHTNSTQDLSSRSKSCAGPRTGPQPRRPQQPRSVGLDAYSATAGWGQVLYQVAGQKCGRCSPRSYEMPLWYAEEAQKVRLSGREDMALRQHAMSM